MIETLVLRFRDFGKDTIQEHQDTITRLGTVWWGWWRKGTEPEWGDALAEFADDLAKSGGRTIGLVDTSTSRHFVATVTSCALAPDLGAGMPSPDPSKTPVYYNNVACPAWFELTGLQPVGADDFYKRFFRIVGGEETLIPLHRKGGKLKPVAAGPRLRFVRTPGNTILHLSDIHFGSDHGFPLKSSPGKLSLLEILQRDVAIVAPQGVAIIVLSGDLTTRADANVLFNVGIPFLKELGAALKVTPERMVVVPGNHDIPLKDASPHNYSHEETYATFVEKLHATDPGRLRGFILGDGTRIELLTLNSVRLRDKQSMNYGYVGWHVCEAAAQQLGDLPDNTLRVAVMHHHLVPAVQEEPIDPDYPFGGVSVTLDAGRVIQELQHHQFGLVLHGHQHVPRVTRMSRGHAKDGSTALTGLSRKLHLVAGGSAGVRQERLASEMAYNSYCLLEAGASKVNVRVRQFNSGATPRDHLRGLLRI